MFTEPCELEYTDLLLIVKISSNFISWSSMVDHAVLKLQSLIWMLEPVYAEVRDYDFEIFAICINLVSSDESSLQYPALDLLEAGWDSTWDSTHNRVDIIDVCCSILKNKEIQPYIKDKIMDVKSNCNL